VHAAKAVGWNDVPFVRHTSVVPSNIVLDKGPGPPTGRGECRDFGSEPQSKFCIANCGKTVTYS